MEVMRGFGLKLSNEMGKMMTSRRILLYANYMAMAYYWFVYLTMLYIVLFVAIPAVQGSYQNIQTAAFVFFMVSIKVNYILCLWNNSIYRGGSTPFPAPKDWYHCITCQHHIPPRAHHCPLCGYCILKREEHCFFIGKCIGHRNHRFYIIFCFYVGCASLFGIAYCAMYASQMYATFSAGGSKLIFFLPFAFLNWLFGSLPTPIFGTIFLMYLCLITFSLGAGLFAFNVLLVLGGQTRYEFDFGYVMKLPHYAAMANVRDTFGKYWWTSFIIPGITSVPEGDGITIRTHKQYKNI